MGAAYRASGRTKPIMDVFALHPYQTRSAIPPGQPHTGTSLGIGDYDKLVALLGAAFDGTAQPGSKLPIAYTEFGVQSLIPASELGSYTNVDSPLGKDAVPEETQAEYYEQAFELAGVPTDRDRRLHLPPLRRGRPEPLAVRPLLRRHEAEVEPRRDRVGREEGTRREARRLFVRFG